MLPTVNFKLLCHVCLYQFTVTYTLKLKMSHKPPVTQDTQMGSIHTKESPVKRFFGCKDV